MQKIKNLIILAAGSFIALFSLAPASAYADNPAKSAIQTGVCNAAGQEPGTKPGECNTGTATTSLNDTIASVINILSVLVGIVAVIMIIVAGFKYITSAGNDQAVAGAKKTLLYAIVGLVVVAFAQVIARFVLNKTTT